MARKPVNGKKRPATPAELERIRKMNEANNGLPWDEERVGRLYELYRKLPEPSTRHLTAAWAEKYPDEAVSLAAITRVANVHNFEAQLYIEQPNRKRTYHVMRARIKAMRAVVEQEAPNASPEFVRGLQGAIFSKVLEDLNEIKIKNTEAADAMLDLAERLVKIEYQMRGLTVGERETETPAQENATSWRKALEEARSKH